MAASRELEEVKEEEDKELLLNNSHCRTDNRGGIFHFPIAQTKNRGFIALYKMLIIDNFKNYKKYSTVVQDFFKKV